MNVRHTVCFVGGGELPLMQQPVDYLPPCFRLCICSLGLKLVISYTGRLIARSSENGGCWIKLGRTPSGSVGGTSIKAAWAP